MSKIVLLSTYYMGTATANGICANNITMSLKKLGHDVNVVCYEDVVPAENNIYTIPQPIAHKRNAAQRMMRKALLGSKLLLGIGTPVHDKTITENYYKALCAIECKQKIDVVIAMYFPIESVVAVYKFKKEHPNVKIVAYELDSVGDGVADSAIQALENRRYEKWLQKTYKRLDNIFVMKSHEEYWRKKFGEKFSGKLLTADIPVLLEKNIDTTSAQDNVISFIYAGLIEKKYRSPSYLLSVLQELDKRIDFSFSFFSKGDCENEIAEVAKGISQIKQKGYVPQEELDKAIMDTDILISIGNSVSRSVPSKIITYISYGKPIIHFSSQEKDVCKEYFEKYPLALVIDQSKLVADSCDEIIEFIYKTRGKTVEYAEIKELFKFNDPAYSALLIEQLVKEKHTYAAENNGEIKI